MNDASGKGGLDIDQWKGMIKCDVGVKELSESQLGAVFAAAVRGAGGDPTVIMPALTLTIMRGEYRGGGKES